MTAAEDAGYHIVIVDSISHEWMGPGGILDTLDKMDDANQFAKWRVLTPRHNKFVDKQLRSKIHLIATLRGKDQYVLEVSNGKQKPKKVGVGAQQRDGLEYEYTVVFEVGMGHYASSTKDRTGMFAHFHDQLTEAVGVQLMEWANSGIEGPERTTSSLLDGKGNGGMDENQRLYLGARNEYIKQIGEVLASTGKQAEALFDEHDKQRAKADIAATKGKPIGELEKVVQDLVAEQGVRMETSAKSQDSETADASEAATDEQFVPDDDFDDDIPWGDDNKSGNEKGDGQKELLDDEPIETPRGGEPEPEDGADRQTEPVVQNIEATAEERAVHGEPVIPRREGSTTPVEFDDDIPF